MALITLSSGGKSISVINGIVDQPLTGIWSADLVLDESKADALKAGDSVTIATSDSKWELKGTVIPDRNAEFLDAVHVRILGGAGGMAKPAKAKAYQKATVNDVLKKLLSDAGESLDSSASDQGFLNTQLDNWSIFSDNTTTDAIVNLIDKFLPGANWRIQNNGKLFIGKESYPDADANYQFDMLEYNPVEGTYILGVTQPSLTPGINVKDIGKVSRARHELNMTSIRTTLWKTLEQQNRTVQNAISNLVYAALPGIDYYALYLATVKSQSSDYLKLDITPDDARLPGMSNIPFHTGVAGVTAQIDANCKVLLGWSAGDPTAPYTIAYNGETAQKIILTVGGTKLTITSSAVDIT